MANKIVPIPKKETVNYGDRIVENFWKPKKTTSFTQSGHKNAIIRLLHNVQDGFVCVCSEKLENKDIIKLLFDLPGKIRVYILVNDYSKELDIINEKALIRFGVNDIGSFVLVNPNSNASKGICFGGKMTDESLQTKSFSFQLSNNETQELFRHFCYQFWGNAQNEIIVKGSSKNVSSKPIDIYYDADKFDGKDYVFGTLFDFVEKTERVKLSGQNIIYFGKEKELPTEIKLETSQDLGDNPQKEFLPKEEFEAQKPTFNDDGVSVQITYSWQNVPFFLPANPKEHNLYTQWEAEKKKIDDFLSTLLTIIEDIEKKENTISKRITRFFLGKKTQFEELKRQIMELQKVDFPNITREERDKIISSIKKISSSISSHSREIDNENRKALLDEEIEKLQQQVDEQKAELTKKETEISEKEGNKIKLNEELQSIEEKSETTDKEDKKIMEELSSKVKSLKDKIRELETFIKRDEDDKNKIAKEIKRLENSIESKKSEKQKIDSQEEKAESSLTALGLKKDKKQLNSNTAKDFEIQNLPQLPQTGKLFSANGTPYLAIENWEEYDDGMSEAKRLNAKLCATK